ncbi:MAG TPA: TldD/PmbA family protein, partial [Novosphingobium sp.]|nr:TldD/PmbA family protein [Novosphingobium sp.]
MLDPTQAQARAAALVDLARRAGADAADAVYSGSSSEGVQVRLGQLEDVERSESEHLDLRVFVGKGSASIGSSDLSDAALSELATRAVAMARAAPEDRFAGLAPEELLARGPFPDLDLCDTREPSPQRLRELALECEDAARAVAGVSNSKGASASASSRVFALATSHGFAGSYAATGRSISATMVAGEGSGMQRDYAWRSAHHSEDLPSPAEIGAQAGTRAVARLDPGRVKSGPMPVVFDPRVGGSLLGHLAGAISGSAIARRASFLLDKEEAQIFAPGVEIAEDPLRRRGLSSHPFDGEGLAVSARKLVDGGRLTGWLMDAAAARQL